MESLFFRPPPFMFGITSPPVTASLDVMAHHLPAPQSATARQAGSVADAPAGSVAPAPPTVARPSSWRSYMVSVPLRRLWPRREERVIEEAVVEEEEEKEKKIGEEDEKKIGEEDEEEMTEEQMLEEAVDEIEKGRRGNWVMNILRVGLIWEGEKKRNRVEEEEEEVDERIDAGDRCVGCCDLEGSESVCSDVRFDRDSFSRLLKKVSLTEARLYARLSYLGSLAYSIPKIKPGLLLKYRGLRFVTSSLEKKLKSSNVEVGQSSAQNQAQVKETELVVEGLKNQKKTGITASAAYQIAASAASYLQYQTKNIFPSKPVKPNADSGSPNEGDTEINISICEETSFVVTTNSMTAVVAAKEEVKEAVANDLNSSRSSPCEWFICDDDMMGTRYFVIQGSETLASWQANLLFEPIQFEGLDVFVHRGIYEAAKGIYEQMLPEVQAHLRSRGKSATLRFTGHSLGGSLSILVNLMLLIRGEASPSSLLPVITFGAPSIMCGGNYLLKKLRLPMNHIQSITMHRDIVPRAFSCSYPDHVTRILKAVNRNFRNHPCLKHKKMLYEPMGELLILQPDEKLSPHHHLLPSGSGLYLFGHSSSDSDYSRQYLQAAESAFFNSPHPLEILSDRSAYGSEGTVTRDHDMNAYLRSVRDVIRMELIRIRKAERERRRLMWSSLVAIEGVATSIIKDQQFKLKRANLLQIGLSGVYHGGKESMKHLKKIVGSRHVQMFVVFLFPARLLVLKALAILTFG